MTVTINPPKTPVTQGSNGIASATVPNVCKMPGPPAPFVPTPLPNIGMSGSSPEGYSKRVEIQGQPVAIRGASFGSQGDIASKGTGGGLISANTHGPTKIIGPGSITVLIEGKAVHLLGDATLNNCGPGGSPPNSAAMAGVVQAPGAPAVSQAPAEDEAFPPQAGEVVVEVQDERGTPVADADVFFDGSRFGTSRQDGRVELGKRDPGAHKVSARLDGVPSAEQTVVLNADESLLVKVVVHHLPDVPSAEYAVDRARFTLSATSYEITVERDLEYVKGWGGSVVKLGASAPAGTGGVIAGLTWPDYRWMKLDGGVNKFWDGAAWQALPAGFALADSNNFCVGFYKSGTKFLCQYGGEWPEAFADWDLNDPAKQARIEAWTDNVKTRWTHRFDLKRIGCLVDTCCRYAIRCDARFVEKPDYLGDRLIVCDGNIRSNDRTWFLGEGRLDMAAHEFGHLLGNGDEYAGAKTVDPALNGDGAVNGIDADSIMGQNLTLLKKRHLRTVAKHFTDMVRSTINKAVTYAPVDRRVASGA